MRRHLYDVRTGKGGEGHATDGVTCVVKPAAVQWMGVLGSSGELGGWGCWGGRGGSDGIKICI